MADYVSTIRGHGPPMFQRVELVARLPEDCHKGADLAVGHAELEPDLEVLVLPRVERINVLIMGESASIFGWVFFLISLGGRAPHVLRAHVGVHRTCGEPDGIELSRPSGWN